MITYCIYCGAILHRAPSHIRKGAQFCGRACYYAHRWPPLAERLAARVERTEDCWLWPGAVNQDGYGTIFDKGHILSTHRAAWELADGAPIPDGWIIGHTCDNRRCVRNDDVGVYTVDGISYRRIGHLWLGTNAANIADCVAKARNARGTTHYSHTRPDALARGDRNGMRRHPAQVRRGEQVHTAQVTTAMVLEIRQLYATGQWTQQALAVRFQVSRSIIQAIVTRRTWRHIV